MLMGVQINTLLKPCRLLALKLSDEIAVYTRRKAL